MTQLRFVYFSAKTRERCARELEDMFASGDVTPGEDPRIERRGDRWCITLPEA